MTSTTSARAPTASARTKPARAGRTGRGGSGSRGAGAAGVLGGVVVAIQLPPAPARRAWADGYRRGGWPAGDRRIGDFTQPRDQLDPLAGRDRGAERAGEARALGEHRPES